MKKAAAELREHQLMKRWRIIGTAVAVIAVLVVVAVLMNEDAGILDVECYGGTVC